MRDILDVTEAQGQARLAAVGGLLDLLVCNAGVFFDRNLSLDTLTAQTLAPSFEVDVQAVLLTVQAQRRIAPACPSCGAQPPGAV